MDQRKLEALKKYPEPEPVGQANPYAKLFFFGTHGSRKTVTACQIGAHRGKVLLHHTDDDWISLLNHPEIEQNVDRVPFQDPYHTKLLSEAIRDQIPPYDQYATFVWDTLGGWVDEFVETLLNNINYSDKNARSRVSGKNSAGNIFVQNMNLITPELTDFNLARMQLRPIVRNLINAPINVIFNAHDRVTENDKGISWKQIRPDMPESCFTVAVRKCSALGFFEKVGDSATVSFKNVKNVTTKSRIGVLNDKKVTTDEAVKLINNWMERVKEND